MTIQRLLETQLVGGVLTTGVVNLEQLKAITDTLGIEGNVLYAAVSTYQEAHENLTQVFARLATAHNAIAPMI